MSIIWKPKSIILCQGIATQKVPVEDVHGVDVSFVLVVLVVGSGGDDLGRDLLLPVLLAVLLEGRKPLNGMRRGWG